MILMIDNYDSFTYNLVQYLGELGEELVVKRNDQLRVSDVARLQPAAIVISPGPGSPTDAGISNELIRTFADRLPILGVCLGHQCIGEVFGGRVVRARRPMHGKTSRIHHDAKGLFQGLPNPFDATRYHSLLVERASLPSVLRVTAWTAEGEIMGLQHATAPIFGVQFHPESIMTAVGKELLRNFLSRARPDRVRRHPASPRPRRTGAGRRRTAARPLDSGPGVGRGLRCRRTMLGSLGSARGAPHGP